MVTHRSGADALLTEAIQRREEGDLTASLVALRAYLTREHALLRLARLTDIADEAQAATRLALQLAPGDALAQRVAQDVAVRFPEPDSGASSIDWAAHLTALTGMTLGQARTVRWPFRGINQPIGDALDQGTISLKDLVWAMESVTQERIRTAARTLLLSRLLDVEPAELPRPLTVITGSRYTEREERLAILLTGLMTGIFFSIMLVTIVASVLILVFRLPIWISLALWVAIGLMILLDRLTTRSVRRFETFHAGRLGEEQVVERLRAVLDDRWVLLRNFTWPGRRGGDIDLVLVGPGGIWAFEVKAYTGAVRNIGDTWEYRGKRGWRKLSAHPGQQARRNAARLQAFCAEQGLNIPWVQPVVIWATDEGADEASRGTLTLEQPATPVWPAETIVETAGELWQRRAALDAETAQRVVALLRETTEAARARVR
ncbi:MAG: NERD domain-containing protein [Chloroflexales bacterium]|nr:NERD domain-containing protein [Chloroflexales bacterium]